LPPKEKVPLDCAEMVAAVLILRSMRRDREKVQREFAHYGTVNCGAAYLRIRSGFRAQDQDQEQEQSP
jgi:hypothetical protein